MPWSRSELCPGRASKSLVALNPSLTIGCGIVPTAICPTLRAKQHPSSLRRPTPALVLYWTPSAPCHALTHSGAQRTPRRRPISPPDSSPRGPVCGQHDPEDKTRPPARTSPVVCCWAEPLGCAPLGRDVRAAVATSQTCVRGRCANVGWCFVTTRHKCACARGGACPAAGPWSVVLCIWPGKYGAWHTT